MTAAQACARFDPGPATDPCKDVSCSEHGTCIASDDGPACDCTPGYRAQALECLPILSSEGPVISFQWQRPSTNTDDTPLRDLRSHTVYWGSTSGDYTQTLDLYADSETPGLQEVTIGNLEEGETYYVAVAAVDAEGNEGPLSEELALVAQTPPGEFEPAWDDTITALPYTISSPGHYRVAADLTQNGADGILVNSSDVHLYGGNGYYGDAAEALAFSFSASEQGSAIRIGNGYQNVEIYGFDFSRGAAVHTTLDGSAAVRVPGTIGAGARIHHNHFELSGDYAFGVYGDNLGDARIYQNSVILRDGSTNLAFVRGGSSSEFKVYENIITQRDTAGYVGAFHFVEAAEIYENLITIESSVDQGFVAQGWGNTGAYFHDNVINSQACHHRPFNPDGGTAQWQILHNTINLACDTPGSETSRGISMRYGSTQHAIGFNTIDASGGIASRAIRFGGNDESWTGDDPNNIWVYHNTFVSQDAALEFYGLGYGFYSWNNVYDGTSSWAVLMMDDTAGNREIYFNHDETLSTGGLPVSKGESYTVDWTVCDAFAEADVSGDTVGMVFNDGTCDFPVTNTPAAPTELRAIH